MAETTIVYSVDRKCHKPESENDNGESQRKRGLALKAWFQHKTDILLKDIDTDIDTLIFGKLTTINEQSMVLVKHNYVSAFFPVSKCWPDKTLKVWPWHVCDW